MYIRVLQWADTILPTKEADDPRRICAVTVIGELAVCSSHVLSVVDKESSAEEEQTNSQPSSFQSKNAPDAIQTFAKDLLLIIENTVLASLRLQNVSFHSRLC